MGGEVCMEIPAAASGALVTGNRAARACVGLKPWGDSLCGAKAGSAASKVQKATSVSGKAAQRNCVDAVEMDGFLKVPGRCLLAVFAAPQIWGDWHIRPQGH